MQHAHDGDAGVQPNKIGEGERAHGVPCPQFHGGVDAFNIGDAVLEGVAGFVKHGQEQAVDDEAGDIFTCSHGFTHFLGDFHDAFVGFLRGGEAFDDFDQGHHGHGVHEVQADEFIGALGDGGEAGDADGGGVGGEQAFGLKDGVEFGKDFLFDAFIFGGGFDDEIALGEVGHHGGGFQAGHGFGFLGFGEAAFLDLAVHVFGDGGEGFFEAYGVNIEHGGLKAVLGGDVGDTVAHLACADDTDCGDIVSHSLPLLFLLFLGLCMGVGGLSAGKR